MSNSTDTIRKYIINKFKEKEVFEDVCTQYNDYRLNTLIRDLLTGFRKVWSIGNQDESGGLSASLEDDGDTIEFGLLLRVNQDAINIFHVIIILAKDETEMPRITISSQSRDELNKEALLGTNYDVLGEALAFFFEEISDD